MTTSVVEAHDFEWTLRSRDQLATTFEKQTWEAEETAFIVCDMWDYHHSVNAVQRLKEFAPKLDRVLSEARNRGATIIHAPSDCMPFYKEHAARQRALAVALAANAPDRIAEWCHRIPEEELAIYPIDQSDGGEDDDEDDRRSFHKKAGKRQQKEEGNESDNNAEAIQKDLASRYRDRAKERREGKVGKDSDTKTDEGASNNFLIVPHNKKGLDLTLIRKERVALQSKSGGGNRQLATVGNAGDRDKSKVRAKLPTIDEAYEILQAFLSRNEKKNFMENISKRELDCETFPTTLSSYSPEVHVGPSS